MKAARVREELSQLVRGFTNEPKEHHASEDHLDACLAMLAEIRETIDRIPKWESFRRRVKGLPSVEEMQAFQRLEDARELHEAKMRAAKNEDALLAERRKRFGASNASTYERREE